MDSVSPVLTEREVVAERVIALDQPQYYPLVVARIFYSDQSPASLVRFRFSEKDRAAIAAGADLIISQPHHSGYMPLGLQLAFPAEYPLEEVQ